MEAFQAVQVAFMLTGTVKVVKCHLDEQNLEGSESMRTSEREPSSTLRILSGVSERGCNSMAQGSRKFLDISVGGG